MSNFKERTLAEAKELELEKSGHLDHVARLDRLISKLYLIAEGDEDPELEALMTRLVVQVQAPVQPEPPPPPPPPPPPVKRIEIRHEGVYILTQEFKEPFRLNEIVALLCQYQGVTDIKERTRVRSAVASMLNKLIASGRLIQVQKGNRQLPAIYRRFVETENRRAPAFKNGAPAPIEVRLEEATGASGD